MRRMTMGLRDAPRLEHHCIDALALQQAVCCSEDAVRGVVPVSVLFTPWEQFRVTNGKGILRIWPSCPLKHDHGEGLVRRGVYKAMSDGRGNQDRNIRPQVPGLFAIV